MRTFLAFKFALNLSVCDSIRASNPEIISFMKSQGWAQDFARLEQFYMQRFINVTQDVTKGGMRYLVWQEVA